MSFEMPIFPLGVVLFPGMPLPLHILEPRYRLMIRRCLENDRIFGVAQIIGGEEAQTKARPAAIGTAAEILEVAPLADGRMNLQTLGTRRFRILSVYEFDEYLIGHCEWLEDEAPTDGLVRLAFETRRVLSRYFDALALNTELPVELGELDIPHDPFALSMFIGAILTLPNAQKQDLLEMTDTRVRLELESFLLERAMIIQLAYAKRIAQGDQPKFGDANFGSLSDFVSLN